MKRPQSHPRMPTEKLILYLLLLIAGLGLLWYLHHHSVLTDMLLPGVMTTLFIVSGVELLPELVRIYLDRSKRGKFRKFFGQSAFEDGVRLVFPSRTLDPNIKNNPFLTHRKPPGTGDVVPEGVTGWLAFQDVRGAVYITNTISEMTGREVIAVHDKDIEADQKQFCIVSFGLGFTGFTYQAAGYFDPPLFTVTTDESRDEPKVQTDFFTITAPQPSLPPNGDIGIVVRIIPPAERSHPDRVWFVCAGRTAAGTAAAGYFLAKEWERIYALYGTHGKELTKESLLVVVQHAKGAELGYVYDETTDFAKLAGEPVIRWAKAVGIT